MNIKNPMGQGKGIDEVSHQIKRRPTSTVPPQLIPIGHLQQPTNFDSFLRFPNPMAVKKRIQNNHPSPIQFPVRSSTGSRRSRHFVPNECKDEYYWRKRMKNNEAARKSREKRKTIDSVLEDKVLILSQENLCLRNELYAMKVKYGEVDCDDEALVMDDPISEIDHEVTVYSLPPSPSNSLTDNDCKHTSKPVQSMAKTQVAHFFHESSLEKEDPFTVFQQPNACEEQVLKRVNYRSPSSEITEIVYSSSTESACSTSSDAPHAILSNIAAGNFVLTPIDLSKKSPTQSAPTVVPSSSTLQDDPIQQPDCYEAAHVLTNLFKLTPQTSQTCHEDYSQSVKGKSSLPHKLRFKSKNLDY